MLKSDWKYILSEEYIPENLLYREEELVEIARYLVSSILRYRSKDIIFGRTGIGKTVTVLVAKKYAEKYLNEKGVENYKIAYIKAKSHRVSELLSAMCFALEIKMSPQEWDFGDHIWKIKNFVKRTGMRVHYIIDDFEKVIQGASRKSYDNLMYNLYELPVGVTLITKNPFIEGKIEHPGTLSRVRTFRRHILRVYDEKEIRDILQSRIELAFQKGVVSDAALNELVDIVTPSGNIKNGIEILRRCAELIESGKVTRLGLRISTPRRK